VFAGQSQGGTVSFLTGRDPELTAAALAKRGIALRAGLHCAPLAHESTGTLETGTLRASFGHDAAAWQAQRLLEALKVVEVM
jgi:selenocysteine lyase/cysteine desulfurase